MARSLANKDLSDDFFIEAIESAGAIDFADEEFKTASGNGRIVIQKAIATAVAQPQQPSGSRQAIPI